MVNLFPEANLAYFKTKITFFFYKRQPGLLFIELERGYTMYKKKKEKSTLTISVFLLFFA
jgi:hypothetical protein